MSIIFQLNSFFFNIVVKFDLIVNEKFINKSELICRKFLIVLKVGSNVHFSFALNVESLGSIHWNCSSPVPVPVLVLFLFILFLFSLTYCCVIITNIFAVRWNDMLFLFRCNFFFWWRGFNKCIWNWYLLFLFAWLICLSNFCFKLDHLVNVVDLLFAH